MEKNKNYVVRIPLPSRGKYGESSVKVARPTIEDIRDYISFHGNSIVARNQLVDRLCDTDLYKYPRGDRDFVFVSIRGLVAAPVIAGSLTCGNDTCQEEVHYRLDTRQAKVHELPDVFKKDYELEFPVSKDKRVVNLMTVEREELLEEFVSYFEDEDTESDLKKLESDLYTFAEHACMLDGADSFAGIEKNVRYLMKCDPTDFYVLDMYDLTYPCGPELFALTKCEKCGKEYRVKLRMDSTFFGLSWDGLMRKHRFLSRHSSNSFDDFLKYTVQELEQSYDIEKERVDNENKQRRRQAAKNKNKK